MYIRFGISNRLVCFSGQQNSNQLLFFKFPKEQKNQSTSRNPHFVFQLKCKRMNKNSGIFLFSVDVVQSFWYMYVFCFQYFDSKLLPFYFIRIQYSNFAPLISYLQCEFHSKRWCCISTRDRIYIILIYILSPSSLYF